MKNSLPPNNKIESDELSSDRRELQLLFDNFRLEREDMLEQKLDDPATRRAIGKLIGRSFVKTERKNES